MPYQIDLAPIVLSDIELALLGGLLGGDAMVGLPDPFRGWFAHEIEEALNRVGPGLAGRGFLEPRADGTVVIHSGVAMLVCSCLYARQMFVATYTPAGRRQRVRHFFLEDRLAVEMARQWTADPQYRLVPYPGSGRLLERIQSSFRLRSQGAPECQPGVVAEASLARARALAGARDVKSAADFLTSEGLPAATAAALVRTLADPVGNGSLVAMDRDRRGWNVSGLSLLEGVNGLWRLQPVGGEGETLLEVSPCSGSEMSGLISELVSGERPQAAAR